jgi:uncharacterized protein (TIGR03067 family)
MAGHRLFGMLRLTDPGHPHARSSAMQRRMLSSRAPFSAGWMFAAILASLLSPTIGAAADGTDADKPDAERIVGKWVLKETDRPNPIFSGDGQTAELTFEEMKFEFAVLKDGGKVFQIPGTYFLDDKQTPKLLDVTITGDGGSNSVFAIYEFKEGKLRIRLRDNNGQRPADFESKQDDCRILTFARPDSK